MNIRETIGQMFVFGFEGGSLTPELKKMIKNYNPGGLILFSDNYQSPEQLADFISGLNRIRKEYPLLVMVDQEGGSVNRLSKAFTRFPGNEVLGSLEPASGAASVSPDQDRGSQRKKNRNEIPEAPDFAEYERRVRKTVKLAYHQGEALARELRQVGISWNLAPVLDLKNPRSKVLKGRCFGANPEWVSEIGLAFIAGLQDNGVMACGKHFPGHGATDEDSHTCLPQARVTAEEVVRDHVRPFARAMNNGLRSVMMGHVIYPELDSQFPASLSRKIINEILRESLRYDGIILTDDFGMRAIKDHFGIVDAARLALQAGVDVFLVSKNIEDQRSAFEAVVKTVEKGAIEEDRLRASLNRILREKRCIRERFSTIKSDAKKVIGAKEHRKLMRDIENLA